MLVSAVQQCDSAIHIHKSPLSLASPHSHPTPLGHQSNKLSSLETDFLTDDFTWKTRAILLWLASLSLSQFHFRKSPWAVTFLTGAVHSFTVMPLPAFRNLDAPKSSCPSHSPFPSFFLLQGYLILPCCGNPPCHIVFKNAHGLYNGNYKTAEILVLLWLSFWGRNVLLSEEWMGRLTNTKSPPPTHPQFILPLFFSAVHTSL